MKAEILLLLSAIIAVILFVLRQINSHLTQASLYTDTARLQKSYDAIVATILKNSQNIEKIEQDIKAKTVRLGTGKRNDDKRAKALEVLQGIKARNSVRFSLSDIRNDGGGIFSSHASQKAGTA